MDIYVYATYMKIHASGGFVKNTSNHEVEVSIVINMLSDICNMNMFMI